MCIIFIFDGCRCAANSTGRSRSLTQRQSAVARYYKIGEAFNLLKTKNMIYKCQTQRGERKDYKTYQTFSKRPIVSLVGRRMDTEARSGLRWERSVLYLSTPTSRHLSNTVFQSHLNDLYALCNGLSKSVSL